MSSFEKYLKDMKKSYDESISRVDIDMEREGISTEDWLNLQYSAERYQAMSDVVQKIISILPEDKGSKNVSADRGSVREIVRILQEIERRDIGEDEYIMNEDEDFLTARVLEELGYDEED